MQTGVRLTYEGYPLDIAVQAIFVQEVDTLIAEEAEDEEEEEGRGEF